MSKEVRCEQLGLVDCDFRAQGDTPGEVVEQAVEHLAKDHDMNLPDAESIVAGDYDSSTLPEQTRLVVQRLRRALDIHSEAKSSPIKPVRNVPPTDLPSAGTK
jgi:predicted small metal-binding protein